MEERQGSESSQSTRPTRYMSHALVEIRRYRWWPLGVQSAVLLDLSTQGFKAEFTGRTSCKSEESYWMHVPLSPFQIAGPSDILLRITIKWFDESKMRIGGVFELADAHQMVFLEQLIEKIKSQAL